MSKIQWTDETWNPVTGCTKVSAGCKNCYAEALSVRSFNNPRVDQGRVPSIDRQGGKVAGYYDQPEPGARRAFTDVRLHPGRLEKPLHWRRPRRVFVNSMSDLFHEDVPTQFIGSVFRVMEQATDHTFQVLTKRPGRMAQWVNDYCAGVLPNVWLGVSCEDQATADERIPLLLDTPAAVRFVSAEPLLGPINFSRVPWPTTAWLDWVIVGGESGPKARPCDVGWVRDIVTQCRTGAVACFVKQLGAKPMTVSAIGNIIAPQAGWPPNTVAQRVDGRIWQAQVEPRQSKGGDPDEWPEDLRVREWPNRTDTEAKL